MLASSTTSTCFGSMPHCNKLASMSSTSAVLCAAERLNRNLQQRHNNMQSDDVEFNCMRWTVLSCTSLPGCVGWHGGWSDGGHVESSPEHGIAQGQCIVRVTDHQRNDGRQHIDPQRDADPGLQRMQVLSAPWLLCMQSCAMFQTSLRKIAPCIFPIKASPPPLRLSEPQAMLRRLELATPLSTIAPGRG